MKTFRLLLAVFFTLCAAAILFATQPSNSKASQANAQLAGITEHYCAPQWAALTAIRPDTWLDTAPERVLVYAESLVAAPADAANSESYDAWNKHIVSTLALEDYISSFQTLYQASSKQDGGKEEQLANAVASYRAKYELWSCLSLKGAEREVLEAEFQSIGKTLDTSDIFQLESQYHCMGLERIREAVFRLDPLDERFSNNFLEIMHEHLRFC